MAEKTVGVWGPPKVGKSTTVNAVIGVPLSPTDALEATAKALHIDVLDGTVAGLKVHWKDGRVSAEPMQALPEKYTGRNAKNADVERIDLQTTSPFWSDIRFVDTPGIGAQGDFGKRHDEIANAASENTEVDVRIYLLTTDSSEVARLRVLPHQPMIVVRSHSDTLIDMSGSTPFDALENEKLQLEASVCPGVELFYCAPLIALGAELLSDEIFERILEVSSDGSEAVFQLLISRACLEAEIPDTLALSERQNLIAEISKTVVPSGTRYAAWPFWRCACFFTRYYEIHEVEKLREALMTFGGIRALRKVIGSHLRSDVLRYRRTVRGVTDVLAGLKAKASSELACLRNRIYALEDALKHAQGAVCEITDAGVPVLAWLKADEACRSEGLLRYETALTYLESTAFSDGTPGGVPDALKWLLENDSGLPFTLRQQAIEALCLAEKNGDTK